MIQSFIALSEALTGQSQLDRELGDQYLRRAQDSPVGTNLDLLLKEYKDIVQGGGEIGTAINKRIMGNDDLRKIAKVVILLWYFGEFGEGGPAEHYFQGLFWETISAHPPALSGGYFGHWSYPPDN